MHEQEGRCVKSHIEQLEWIWSELISISQRYIYTISVGQMSAWHPVPFIPPHMEDTEMRKSLPTIQDKRELAGGRVDGGGGGPELRWGKFSPVIALCCSSPGGTMTAAEGGHIMIYCPRSLWPKCQTQLMKIWHIVQRPCGRYTKAHSSFSKAWLQIHCLFPKMIIWFIERRGAKAS